jgi:hypothetical protein
MNELIKEATHEAQKSWEKEKREKVYETVKKIVKATLEKIEELEKRKDNIQEEIRILKKDIDDLKAGKLDAIKERQDINPRAKDVSIIIIKEKEIIRETNPWYVPYYIEIKPNIWPIKPPIWYNYELNDNQICNDINNYSITKEIDSGDSSSDTNYCASITCSDVKNYTAGTYKLEDGTIKYL